MEIKENMKHKKFLFACALAVVALPSAAQSPIILGTDVKSNALDAANSSSRQEEKQTLNSMLDFVNKWSDRINGAMDTVNNVMNTAGEYIAGAREVEKAGRDVADVISIYETFVDDISSQQWLTPSQRLRYINQIIGEVNAMQRNFNKITSLAGLKGKDAAVAGHMNDGQRLKLIRGYASYVSQTCASVRNIYSMATGHASVNKYSYDSYISAMSAIAGF